MAYARGSHVARCVSAPSSQRPCTTGWNTETETHRTKSAPPAGTLNLPHQIGETGTEMAAMERGVALLYHPIKQSKAP